MEESKSKTSPKRSASPKRSSSSKKTISPKRSSSLKRVSSTKRSASPKRSSSSKKSVSPRKSSSPKGQGSGLPKEMSAAYSPPKEESPESFFVPGSQISETMIKLSRPKSSCVIGNKDVIEAQKFIETFESIRTRKSTTKQYSAPFHALPSSGTDNNVPLDKWPNLVDKRFSKWISQKFTDDRYKPKKWKAGQDPCACESCGLPKRTGPWKGNYCECDAKTFGSESDSYLDFLNAVGFPHQKFIVDYFTKDSPYRGILVYHGLGSGKTCTAVALAEMLSQKKPLEKDIVCMLPASLKDNYMKDLLKCGNNVYRQINKHKMNITNLMEKCSDSSEYLEGILHNLEYVLNEFKNQKYHFISYNASNVADQLKKIPETHLSSEELKRIPSYNPKYYDRNNRFNHKIIIVDECHDLISRIIGGGGKGIWDKEFYAKIMAAQDCKIVFMSGTPIQNDVFELAITMNILRGYVGTNKSGGRLMLFPNSFKDFHAKFISEDMSKVINEDVFKRRLIGLVSNFQSTSGFFPEEKKVIVDNFLSDYQFSVHERIKQAEKEKEDKTWTMRRQKRDKFRGLAVGTRVLNEKESSTYSVFSRQACNFVFPDDIYRPNTLIPPPEIPLVYMQDPIMLTSKRSSVSRTVSVGGVSPSELVDDTVEQVIEAQEEGTAKNKKMREYLRQIKNSLQYLFTRSNTTMCVPELGKYSQKMMKIIKNISDGCNLQTDVNGSKISPIWNNENSKWIYNLKDSAVSVEGKNASNPPTSINGSEGPVFIYSFFKSVEGAEILSYAFYEDGYVAVPDVGSGGLFDRSFPNGILDKVNSNTRCVFCGRKLKDHINFNEKLGRLDPDLMVKIDKYLPEGEAMSEWLEKSTSIVKRKSVKPGKGTVVVDYVKISNLCEEDVQQDVESEARDIYRKLIVEDKEDLTETGLKISKLRQPYRSRAIEICRRISEKRIHISNLWQLVSIPSLKVSGETNQFDFRGGLTQEKVDSVKLKCSSGSETFKPLRFVVWSGDSKKEMSGNLLLNKFNSMDNKFGHEIKVMIATRVAGQGVSLMNVRQVHILEPHWNEAKIKQAIGRASRVCSHGSLPFDKRNVDVFRYFSQYSPHQVSNFETTDNELGMLSVRKNYLINKVEDIMREMSVDCNINTDGSKCFKLSDAELEGENLMLNLYEPDIDSSIDVMRRTVIKYLPPLISRPICGMENNQVLLMISSEMGFVLKKEGLVLAKPKYIAKNILVINKKGEITLRPISTAFDGKDLLSITALDKHTTKNIPEKYFTTSALSIKDLSKWPNGIWEGSPSEKSTPVNKREPFLAFRKWQKELYETNLTK